MWEHRHRQGGDGGGWKKEWEKSNSARSLLLTLSRHRLHPPIQLLIPKSEPGIATNRDSPAPQLRCIPELRSTQTGGGRLFRQAGNIWLLKWNAVVGNSVWAQPSTCRLSFSCSLTGFYSLEQCLPPDLQIAEISHRPLYFSYKSVDIRLDCS